MGVTDGADLYKRVERYETAFNELREAHEDVKEILHVKLLHERWRQLGTQLGFETGSLPDPTQDQSKRDLAALQEMTDMNRMDESWAG